MIAIWICHTYITVQQIRIYNENSKDVLMKKLHAFLFLISWAWTSLFIDLKVLKRPPIALLHLSSIKYKNNFKQRTREENLQFQAGIVEASHIFLSGNKYRIIYSE